MDRPPRNQYRPRKMAVICGAAIAAALFTPVPATADVIHPPWDKSIAGSAATTPPIPRPDTLAQSLISIGMIGMGLSMGGLVIVAYRRRQW
jgi:hypothetical protein